MYRTTQHIEHLALQRVYKASTPRAKGEMGFKIPISHTILNGCMLIVIFVKCHRDMTTTLLRLSRFDRKTNDMLMVICEIFYHDVTSTSLKHCLTKLLT